MHVDESQALCIRHQEDRLGATDPRRRQFDGPSSPRQRRRRRSVERRADLAAGLGAGGPQLLEEPSFGVRLAIGARPSEVFRLVVADGLTVVVAGIAGGAALSWLASARIESLLFDVPSRDGVTYAAIAALLVAAGLIACVVPAARASRVDPVVALRAE